jgi:hypothetical protein
MSATIFQAAADLQRQILAPAGAVNTIAQTRAAPQYIRVLVEPMYWHTVVEVPREFEGYPVTVEKREPATQLNR